MTHKKHGEDQDRFDGNVHVEDRPGGSIPLEPADPPAGRNRGQGPGSGSEPDSIRALDVCPNCGAALGSIQTVMCMRCGYNLKTMRVEKTRSTVEEPRQEEEAAGTAEPLCRPGRGDLMWPGIAAGVSGLVLLIGYLVGAAGLYGAELPGFFARVGAAGSGLLLVVILAACALAGVYFVARFVHEAPLGDLRLAGVRVVCIAAAMRLWSLVELPTGLEFPIEFIFQAVTFIGLAMYLFTLDVRDAVLAGLGTLAGFLVMIVVSSAVRLAI